VARFFMAHGVYLAPLCTELDRKEVCYEII